MEYMSINQAAQEWGITPRRVQVLCAQARIEGACRIGNVWAIPKNAQKPEDARIKSGKYMSQLKGWMDAYVKIGESMSRASEAYLESKKKLVDSNQSVIKKIDKLERLGISPKRSRSKIDPSARIVAGTESVIPKELSLGDTEEDE